MNIENNSINKKQILIMVILLVGLIVGMYLVSNRQILKSRAFMVSSLFTIIQDTNPQKDAICDGDSCTSETLDIVIKPNLSEDPKGPIRAKVTVPKQNSNSIASCTFYRNGVGNMFRNTVMPDIIHDIAGKVGVPASALAGILRIESPDPFNSPNNEYVTNDYDAHSSGVAYGLMQFVPATFESVFNRNRLEMQSLFGKTAVQTRIESQKYPAPEDNILHITSIKDSLTATAFKIREDARSKPPYDRQAVSNILSAYFGSHCGYEGSGSDYCTDMLKSMENCGGI